MTHKLRYMYACSLWNTVLVISKSFSYRILWLTRGSFLSSRDASRLRTVFWIWMTSPQIISRIRCTAPRIQTSSIRSPSSPEGVDIVQVSHLVAHCTCCKIVLGSMLVFEWYISYQCPILKSLIVISSKPLQDVHHL